MDALIEVVAGSGGSEQVAGSFFGAL